MKTEYLIDREVAALLSYLSGHYNGLSGGNEFVKLVKVNIRNTANTVAFNDNAVRIGPHKGQALGRQTRNQL